MKQKKRVKQFPPLQLRKKQYRDHNSEVTYWTTLVVILLSNLISSVVMIPFLLVLPAWAVYAILGFLGIVFGVLFAFLTKHIRQLELHHHLLGVVVLTGIAVLNLALVVTITNSFGIRQFEPVALGLVYGTAFILPYAFHHGWRKF